MKLLLSAIILIAITVEDKGAHAGLYCDVSLSNECSREGCDQGSSRNASISINLTDGSYISCMSRDGGCIRSEIKDVIFTFEYTLIRSEHGASLKVAKKPNHMTFVEIGEFVEYQEDTFGVISRYGKCSDR